MSLESKQFDDELEKHITKESAVDVLEEIDIWREQEFDGGIPQVILDWVEDPEELKRLFVVDTQAFFDRLENIAEECEELINNK